MQFIDFKDKLKIFTVFGLNDIRKVEPNFDLRRLNEWVSKGYLKKIRRGFYIFSDLEINEQFLFLLANTIYTPSYISLEMAFSWYNFIPEGVYQTTSVTSKKTNTFKTAVGNFIYQHLKSELMFGYELKKYNNQYYKIAEPAKAVLDYFYLNPDLKNEADFKGLRLNIFEFKANVDVAKLKKYLQAFNNQELTKRVNKFLTYLKNA